MNRYLFPMILLLSIAVNCYFSRNHLWEEKNLISIIPLRYIETGTRSFWPVVKKTRSILRITRTPANQTSCASAIQSGIFRPLLLAFLFRALASIAGHKTVPVCSCLATAFPYN